MTKVVSWSVVLASFAVAWWTCLGFSGFSAAHVDAWLSGAIGHTFDPTPLTTWSTAILVDRRPDDFVTIIRGVSTSLVALSAVSLFLAARRTFQSLYAAVFCALLFVGSVESYWAASSAPGPALAVLIASLVIFAATLERPWVRSLSLGGLAAIALGLMPPLAIAIALIWIFESFDYRHGSSNSDGVSTEMVIPVAYFGALLSFGGGLLGFTRAFGLNTEQAWKWLLDMLKHSDSLTFLGVQYVDSRPPLWTGLLVFVTETSLILILLSGIALLFRTHIPARFGRTLCCLAAVGLVSPWLIRGTSWSDISVNLMWAPVLAVLAGLSLALMSEHLFNHTRRFGTLRQPLCAATITLVLTGMYFGTLGFRQAPDSYRNGLWSQHRSLKGGDPLKRSDIWPPGAFRGRVAEGSSHNRLAEVYSTQKLVQKSRASEHQSWIGHVSTRRTEAPLPTDPFAIPVSPWSVRGIPLLWSEVSRSKGDPN